VSTPGSDESPYPPPPPVDAGPVAPRPPREIVAAFWGYVVAAVSGLIGGLMVLGSKQQIVDAIRTANNQSGGKLTDTQVDQAATVAVVLALVVAVIVSLLYLLLAFKLKAGRNWARILLTIIAVIALISLLVGRGGTALSYLGEAAAVIAAVLSYLPNSNAYFAAGKTRR
jgi:hypothetical protein